MRQQGFREETDFIPGIEPIIIDNDLSDYEAQPWTINEDFNHPSGQGFKQQGRRTHAQYQQKMSRKKLHENNQSRSIQNNQTSKHIDKYRHQENIKADDTYKFLKFQHELEQFYKENPELASMVDLIQEKISPLLEKHRKVDGEPQM